jgi:hypothetical protein
MSLIRKYSLPHPENRFFPFVVGFSPVLVSNLFEICIINYRNTDEEIFLEDIITFCCCMAAGCLFWQE